MNYRKFKQLTSVMLSAFFYITAFLFPCLETLAAPAAGSGERDYQLEAQERKSLPIQSNQIENWPEGPAIGAQSAILLEANTGAVLYAKNIHERLYPASTTKLMTCLVAAENSDLNETVSFSHDAVFALESGSSNIGIDPGQAMPMEECLYGILVASANEVANAVAEHVAGSMDAFAEMMNEKAAALGCEDTNFVNAHGLYDENHYTSAYDLALIAKAFFQNELLSKIGNTASYHFKATASQPDDFITRNKHQLITGEIACEGVKGGKTGYTDEARQTLVTCAERNGMKLICVIMKEESPDQFLDTVKLFDYGFANFSSVNIAENETGYTVENTGFFHNSQDIFGNSEPFLTLNKDSYLILPSTVDFDELTSEISYEGLQDNQAAKIIYTYHDAYIGTAAVDLSSLQETDYAFNSSAAEAEPGGTDTAEDTVIFINVKLVLLALFGIAVLLIFLSFLHDMITNYSFLGNGRHGIWRSAKTIRRRDHSLPRRKKRNRKKGPHLPSSRFKDFTL